MQLDVVTRSPRRLVFRLRPTRVSAYWGFGFLFIALGLGVAWMLARAASLVCVRDAGGGNCAWATTVGFRTHREYFPDLELRGARVERVDAGLVQSMRLVVSTDRGDRALDLSNATGQTKTALAAEITAFAEDASLPSLRVGEDNRLMGLLFGLFLVGAGVACIAVIESAVVVMDRDRRVVRIRGLRHGVPRRVDIALDRVRGVGIEAFTVRRARSFNVYFNLGDRVREPLMRSALFTEHSAQQTVGVIQSWLEETPR